MTPKESFWEAFSSLGRLKRQWVQGLKDPDPITGLERFRAVLQSCAKNPEKTLSIWLPFLESLITNQKILLLMPEDMKLLLDMGERLETLVSPELHADDFWFKVVEAYEARNELRESRSLLARIYYRTPVLSVKTKCAHKLAELQSKGDEQIAIYVDYLRSLKSPGEASLLIQFLTELCSVTVDSGHAKLKQAAEIAGILSQNKIVVDGIEHAIGLYRLLVEKQPENAIPFLMTAATQHPDNPVLLAPLVAANLQIGEYERAIQMVKNSTCSADETLNRLTTLAATLLWLNNAEAANTVPCSAQWLTESGLEKYATDFVGSIIGKLLLLEGDPRQALNYLKKYSDRQTQTAQWLYYKASAAALIGDSAEIFACLEAANTWQGQWTIAAMLWDCNPELAETRHVAEIMEHVSPEYTSIVAARKALSSAVAPCRVTAWLPVPYRLEENLESLRTLLGIAYYHKQSNDMAQLMSQQLFMRLPLSDQLMWKGLFELATGNAVSGVSLLEEAVTKYGNKRAALIEAVYQLQHHNLKEAKRLLDFAAADRADRKIELIRAFIDTSEQNFDRAHERFHTLLKDEDPRAYYGLGNLQLHRATIALKEQQKEKAIEYYTLAFHSFRQSLQKGEDTIPADAAMLLYCTEFIISKGKEYRSFISLWEWLLKSEEQYKQPWLMWYSIVGQLWFGSSETKIEACSEAQTLLKQCDAINSTVLSALVKTLAHECMQSVDPDYSDALIFLCNQLLLKNQEPVALELFNRSITRTIMLQHSVTFEVNRVIAKCHVERSARMYPDNVSFALFLAQLCLEQNNTAEALYVLQTVKPQSAFERAFCMSLMSLINGSVPDDEILSLLSIHATGELILVAELIEVVGAFLLQKHDRVSALLIPLLQKADAEIAQVFDIKRILPALCMRAGKSVRISKQVGTIYKAVSGSSHSIDEDLVFARCGALLGDSEMACRLWEKALQNELVNNYRGVHEEYAKYLCYLALQNQKSGNSIDAIQKLRYASQILQQRSSV